MSSNEGLWIERRGRRINSKVKTNKQGEYDYIDEMKLRVYKLDLNVSSPSAPPGPLYRWPGLRVPVKCDTNSKIMSVYIVVFIFDSLIIRLLSWA
jgi:hypothetical protein